MQNFFNEDPHRVGRFVATHLGRESLTTFLSGELHRSAERNAPPGFELPDLATGIESVVKELARHSREQSPVDPFRVLAELRLPIYLTTDPFDTLADALRDAGADPVVEFYRWDTFYEFDPPVWEQDSHYSPTPERPLVLHLFGRWRHPSSLVLSDDDLLDFTMQMEVTATLPPFLLTAINRSSLLFVGFGVDDADFRVVHKVLQRRLGVPNRERLHVAAQIELSEDVMQNHVQARDFFDHYFDRVDVAVYWGTVEEFARTLKAKMEEVL
jgi:hypothetical protein